MSKPYDSTLKALLDRFGSDWLRLFAAGFGLPADVSGEPLDADLSTVQLSADRVFRLLPPAEGLVHVEPQSTWDGELPDRLLEYNALLHRRYVGPVHSVALLLRPRADGSALTGTLSRRYADGREYLRFEYQVVRVWTLPAEPLLTGGIGLTPLAFITDDAEPRLGEYVDRIDARCRAEGMPDGNRQELMLCGELLCGLRYTEAEIAAAFVRVKGMRESVTYQRILREGEEKGREEGGLIKARQSVLAVLSERFAVVPPEVVARVEASTDQARLDAAVRQAVRIADPNDLLL